VFHRTCLKVKKITPQKDLADQVEAEMTVDDKVLSQVILFLDDVAWWDIQHLSSSHILDICHPEMSSDHRGTFLPGLRLLQ